MKQIRQVINSRAGTLNTVKEKKRLKRSPFQCFHNYIYYNKCRHSLKLLQLEVYFGTSVPLDVSIVGC